MKNMNIKTLNLEKKVLENKSKYNKSIERYKSLGVKQFKSGLMKIFRKLFKSLPNYSLGKDISRESLEKCRKMTFLNELIHSPQIALAGYELIKSASEKNYANAALCYGLVLINGYCTMTQRYNRARINRILDKI